MEKMYKTGDIVEGVVSGIQPYGAFVNLNDGGTGLVHISEISEDYVKSIEDYLKVGETATFYVIDFDAVTMHAKLSLKQLQSDLRKKRRTSQVRQRKKELIVNKKYFTSISMVVEDSESSYSSKQYLRVIKDFTLMDVDYASYQKEFSNIHNLIESKEGLGNDYLGWVDYPSQINEKELLRIIKTGEEIRNSYDTFVIVGIGGSYIGAKAAIEMINGLSINDDFKILYLGNTFSSNYTKKILDYLKGRNYCINVISKSGSTLETAIAFRLLKEQMNELFGVEETKKRIFVTTDKENGQLRELTNKEGYVSFEVPQDIGGRYSVLTPVGLLPMAVANIDIMEVILGAKQARIDCKEENINKNSAYQYALLRNLLAKEKSVEMLATYEPQMMSFAEWWKQLFGESEGKEEKGLLPTSVNYSTDLHSLGQFVQGGSKILFETVLISEECESIIIPRVRDYQVVLKNVEGRDLANINKIASDATMQAHNYGKVPNISIHFKKLDAYGFGYLSYFFMYVCLSSAYLLNVNPTNQPAVEVYKSKMRELLDKRNDD